MFKIYDGNVQQYFTELFANSEEFLNALAGLSIHDGIENFAKYLADTLDTDKELWDDLKSFEGSANGFYEKCLKSSDDCLLDTFQQVMLYAFEVSIDWKYSVNNDIYKIILTTLMHGSTSNFFYKNRYSFLPEYDWYLIEKEEAKKGFTEEVFKEFDRLSMIVSSIRNLGDIDNVPTDYLIKLIGVTGFSVNDYKNSLTDSQIRNLAKNIMDVYRYKGNINSFKIMFNSIGIEPNVEELYFDRRLYYSLTGTDKYDFEKYLTPHNPGVTSVKYTDEDVNTGALVYPMSEKAWSYLLDLLNDSDKDVAARYLLGYLDEGSISNVTCKDGRSFLSVKKSVAGGQSFTYFKTNFLRFDLKKIGSLSDTKITDEDELNMCKALINKICPIYINKIYQ